jgi:hypothetical protein
MKLEYDVSRTNSYKNAINYFANNQVARRFNHLFYEEKPVDVDSNIQYQGEVRVH